MKQHMRIGVLAGLMVAPTVVVSANENIQTDESIAVVDAGGETVAAASTAVAVLDSGFVTDMRLKEFYLMNEDSAIQDIKKYKETLDIIIPIVDFTKDTPYTPIDVANETEKVIVKKLLTAKLNYLDNMQKIKVDLYALNNAIGQLNVKNPDTITKVKEARALYNKFASDYQSYRNTLDTEIKKIENNPNYAQFLTDAFSKLGVYPMSSDAYLKKVVPKTDTLIKFEQSVIKPEDYIEYTQQIDVGAGNTVVFDLNDLATMSTLNSTDIPTFKEYTEAIWYVLDNGGFTADEKSIFLAHKLGDGQIVGTILNDAKNDIKGADAVLQSIENIKDESFKSETTFISKITAIDKLYEKLSPRGKSLVTTYATVVESHDESGKNAGYKAAVDVINAIKALKPANTQAYRDAVDATDTVVTNLHNDYLKFVINKPKLDTYQAELLKAKTVEGTIDLLNSSSTTAADIIAARTDYTALSANEKKVFLKEKLTALTDWEKTAKDSIKVNDTITKIKIENTKTFATSVENVQKAYDALGTVEKQGLVASKNRLSYMSPLAKLTGQANALKLGATDDYRNMVNSIYTDLDGKKDTLTFNTDTTIPEEDKLALERLYDSLWTQISPKVLEVDAAKLVELKITTAKNATGADQLTKIQEARADYTDLSSNEKKIVNNLKTLTELEKLISQPAKVATSIEAVDPLATTFESKAKAAITAYDKLTSSQKAYIDSELQKQVKDYQLMLDFLTQMKALKVSNATYRDDLTELEKRISSLKTEFTSVNKSAALIEALEKNETSLTKLKDGISVSDKVVDLIEALPSKSGQDFLDGINQIEKEYNKLSADGKKLVTNYKTFQNLKKDGTTSLRVVDLINNSYITGLDVANSNFEKAFATALNAYEKLTSAQRLYVFNYDSRLKPYLKVYELVVAINKLKPTNKTYYEDVSAIRKMYDALTEVEKTVAAPLLSKIEGGELFVADVQNVMDLINAAEPGTENYVEKLKAARAAYDRLATVNSALQKLVLNYKTLQDREKAISPVTSSIYEIQELELLLYRPFNSATDFVKKYQAAMKAYEKIPFESRQLVTNREVLLNEIYPIASTMEAILTIKDSSKTFGEDVVKAREMYNALTPSQQQYITNYSTLTSFENLVKGGTEVDALIRAIPTKAGAAYMQAIKDARAAYNQLTTSEKKAVSLYKELQSFENGVKTVQTAIDLIDALQFSSNLITAYDKAIAALDKLTAEQRLMVNNLNKLTAVAPAIEVYKMITNLKPSSEGYSGAVQAAYAAYNRLSNAEKLYVTNFATLQEAKNNVDNLAKTIAKIAEIVPGSRNYATQLQEALALYNTLPASMKKLVTNYDVLKNSQTELNAVEKVRSLIGEIDENSSTFVQKVIAARTAYDALTSNQKRLVSNYFMLEEYERKLGTMF